MKKKVNIGVVTSTYAREAKDYQVPWMRELISRTNRDGCNVKVFAPSFKGLNSHEIDGVAVHRFRYAPSCIENLTHDEGAPSKSQSLSNKFLAVSYILCGLVATLWWCVRYRIDVLHVHWPFPHGLWAILPKYILGVRVVAMSHGAELAMARRNNLIRGLLGWLLRRADVRCANSSHTASEVLSVSGCDDVQITPYGATVENKTDSSVKDDNDTPTLLFCGRLVQRKGIDVLLKALPKVLAEVDVKLVITGEGDCKREWEALSDSLNLQNNVKFAGFVSNEELSHLYQTSQMYVHPAVFDDRGDTEGLGVVLIEALSYKLPVIASSVGGIVDVIKHNQTGILVNEKDEDELAGAILSVLHDDERAKKLGQKGFLHVKKFFDWNRIADQMMGIYQGQDRVEVT